MRPIIIGIGGAYSSVGKTTIASILLNHLKGWGAIKYTPSDLYCSILDDREILRQEGKDTAILLSSGAEEVLWVQSPPLELKEVISMAIDRLSHLRGIIVEGNSAIEFLKPDIVIFISGRDTETLKESAINILNMADIILFQHEPSIKLPERAKKIKVAYLSISELDECINYIYELLNERQGSRRG